MAELTYTWWRANKARTLRNEPLSEVLRRIQDNQQGYIRTRGGRADYMIPLRLEMDPLILAIRATRRRCSRLIHGATIANLNIMENLAKRLKSDLNNKLRAFDRTMEGIKKNRIAILTKLTVVLRRPTVDNIQEVLEMLYVFGMIANKALVKHRQFGLLISITGGRTQGGGLCGRLQRMQQDLVQNGSTTTQRKGEVRLELRRFLEWDI
jgi:hypothetical protein